ncbi:unnamed protein product [Adineta steineri]|uniref:Uncharacterized protein n=1 Tax=Adineta steineri TaxID=433720 RepID=A0A815KPA5_9BILA|nr:unnamed protein product [Adineta steineri]
MIDLVIVYLSFILGILLLIIAFLIFYIIHERRKTTIIPLDKTKRIILPLLTLKSNDRSSGDHSNSATRKRMIKRLRHRPPTLFIRTENSQGFLLANSDLSSISPPNNKLIQQNDQTTIHFDC